MDARIEGPGSARRPTAIIDAFCLDKLRQADRPTVFSFNRILNHVLQKAECIARLNLLYDVVEEYELGVSYLTINSSKIAVNVVDHSNYITFSRLLISKDFTTDPPPTGGGTSAVSVRSKNTLYAIGRFALIRLLVRRDLNRNLWTHLWSVDYFSYPLLSLMVAGMYSCGKTFFDYPFIMQRNVCELSAISSYMAEACRSLLINTDIANFNEARMYRLNDVDLLSCIFPAFTYAALIAKRQKIFASEYTYERSFEQRYPQLIISENLLPISVDLAKADTLRWVDEGDILLCRHIDIAGMYEFGFYKVSDVDVFPVRTCTWTPASVIAGPEGVFLGQPNDPWSRFLRNRRSLASIPAGISTDKMRVDKGDMLLCSHIDITGIDEVDFYKVSDRNIFAVRTWTWMPAFVTAGPEGVFVRQPNDPWSPELRNALSLSSIPVGVSTDERRMAGTQSRLDLEFGNGPHLPCHAGSCTLGHPDDFAGAASQNSFGLLRPDLSAGAKVGIKRRTDLVNVTLTGLAGKSGMCGQPITDACQFPNDGGGESSATIAETNLHGGWPWVSTITGVAKHGYERPTIH